MLRTSSAILLAAILILGVVAVAVPKDEDASSEAVETAYKAMIEERRGYEEMADRLEVTKTFLAQYPESKYTARLIMHVFYYQGEQLGDQPGAIAYGEELRGKVKDPEVILQIDKTMVELYGDAGMLDKMTKLATKLEAADEMKFNDYWNIIETGTAYKDWAMVRTYTKKAWPLADAEAYRSDYPAYEFTDEEALEAGSNRTAMVAGKDAWALANMGMVDEAINEFELVSKKIKRSYVGVADYDIGLHWANTLMMKGDYKGAIEHFAPEALIMQSEDALAGMMKAYAEMNGSEDGFDEFARDMHIKIAPKVSSFELPGYDGKTLKYEDMRGEVTLLAFWFPT